MEGNTSSICSICSPFPPTLPITFCQKGKNLPSTSSTSTRRSFISKPSILTLTSLYFLLGMLLAGDNVLYSVRLYHLPLSTYSLLCATQLEFNGISSSILKVQRSHTQFCCSPCHPISLPHSQTSPSPQIKSLKRLQRHST